MQAGQLRLGTALLADAANVYLSTGATLDLSFTGNADAVHGLYFDAPRRPPAFGRDRLWVLNSQALSSWAQGY